MSDDPTVLINSGEIDLLTVHHSKKVGGEILYPCRDSDEDDAIDNIPELVGKLASPMKRPYRISLFGAGSGTEIDAPETATLTLLPEEGPEVARKLSATLEHPEGDIAEVSWQWQRSADGLAEQPPPPPVSTTGQPEVDRESGRAGAFWCGRPWRCQPCWLWAVAVTTSHESGDGPRPAAEVITAGSGVGSNRN